MKNEIKALLTIVVFYAIIELLGVTCPIKFLTGISCAGCGMSRAWLSVLQGNIDMAFYYHPLFLLVIPLIIFMVLAHKTNKKIFKVILVIILIIFITVYFIRMIFFPDAIVCFAPREGIIFKALHRALELYLTDETLLFE